MEKLSPLLVQDDRGVLADDTDSKLSSENLRSKLRELYSNIGARITGVENLIDLALSGCGRAMATSRLLCDAKASLTSDISLSYNKLSVHTLQ